VISKARKPVRDDKQQSKLFIEKAREIEADEKRHSAADKLMERLANRKPEPKGKQRTRGV
jgi:hypothetical protein